MDISTMLFVWACVFIIGQRLHKIVLVILAANMSDGGVSIGGAIKSSTSAIKVAYVAMGLVLLYKILFYHGVVQF